jgi:hypothetical protein
VYEEDIEMCEDDTEMCEDDTEMYLQEVEWKTETGLIWLRIGTRSGRL